MITSKKINFNGLEIDANTLPRTLLFCKNKWMNIQKNGEYVTVTGGFSLSVAEVKSFYRKKQPKMRPLLLSYLLLKQKQKKLQK